MVGQISLCSSWSGRFCPLASQFRFQPHISPNLTFSPWCTLVIFWWPKLTRLWRISTVVSFVFGWLLVCPGTPSTKHYSHTASSYLIASWDSVLKFESKILISLSLELSCFERLVIVKFCQLLEWNQNSPYVLLIHHIIHVSLRCR